MNSDEKMHRFRGTILYLSLALLAGGMVFLAWHGEPMLSRDGSFYAMQVSAKMQDGISFYHADFAKPPLFQLGAYGICRVGGVSAGSAILILNVVSLMLMVFPMAYLARRILKSVPVALLCTAWLVTSPLLIRTARGGSREPLFLCLLLFSLGAALRYGEKHFLPWLTVSAVLMVLSALTRFEGGVGFVLILCYVLFGADPAASWKLRIGHGAVFCLASVATAAVMCLFSMEMRLFFLRMAELIAREGAKIL